MFALLKCILIVQYSWIRDSSSPIFGYARSQFQPLSNIQSQEDIDEANRLMEMSKSSLIEDENTKKKSKPVDAIYSIIRELKTGAGGDTIKYVHRIMFYIRLFQTP